MSENKVLSGPEVPSDEEKEASTDKVTVYLGVFFDGTNNNKYNIDDFNYHMYKYVRGFGVDPREKYSKTRIMGLYGADSFLQGYSNVAYLSEAFFEKKVDDTTYFKRVYVEGIGTEARDVINHEKVDIYSEDFSVESADTKLAQGDGSGIASSQGVKSRVKRACELIKRKLVDFMELSVVVKLNVVGFSRGSAAARCFTSWIEGNDSLCLKSYLKNFVDITVEVEFLGLFDTVSSYGFIDMLRGYLPGKRFFSNDVNQLSLDVSNPEILKRSKASLELLKSIEKNASQQQRQRAQIAEQIRKQQERISEIVKSKSIPKKVFQLCAADEYRVNFSLTRVSESDEELIIPGCHSDVGGGYLSTMKEEMNPSSICKELYDVEVDGEDVYKVVSYERSLYNGFMSKDKLFEEGWFNKEKDAKSSGGYERVIYNIYSRVPFLYMLEHFADASSRTEKDLFDDNVLDRFCLSVYELDILAPDYSNEVDGESVGELYILDNGTNFYMSDIYNLFKDKKLYEFDSNGDISDFLSKDEREIALIRALRHNFIHLSAKKGAVNAAAPGNRRIVIKV
ncbi:MAG: DUF2235 domain-containing protein [Paludibacteraceae bacterium]|nr:DUF2235 domain-containing protein [Paludibacteraceae bacterium]